MLIEWVGPVPSGNYSAGRRGRRVSGVVDHWIGGGTADGAVAHFRNPRAGVSAHYVLSGSGRIRQLVALEDTAYHAGNIEVNLSTVGIEHEAHPELPPTDALYDASAWLHAHLASELGLELALGSTVRGHRDIVPTQCPGTVDLDRIIAEAKGVGEMDEATVRRILEDVLRPYRDDVRATFEAIKSAEQVIREDNRATAEAIKAVIHEHLREHGGT